MPFRSDEEILDMTRVAMIEAGSPNCLFTSGCLPLNGFTDREAAPFFFPYDSEAYQSAMSSAFEKGGTSTCGLLTEDGWRYAGVDAPVLYEPYNDRVAHGKYVVMMEKIIAEDAGAWQSAIPWIEGTPLPMHGDAPIIGCTSCGSGWARGVKNLEHEYVFLCYDPAGNGIHHSIDGGQPGVKLRTRALVEVWTGETSDGRRKGELWASTVNDDGSIPLAYDGRPVTGRRFIGFTRVAQLPRGAPQGPCLWEPGLVERVTSSTAGKLVLGASAVALLAALVKRYFKG